VCSSVPFFRILQQYGDGGPALGNTCSFGGFWTDTTAYPHAGTTADPLVSTDIQDSVDRAIAANGGWNAPGLSTMYFVYLAKNIVECFNQGTGSCFSVTGSNYAKGYCAYHYIFGSGPRIYANMPFAATGKCGGISPFPNGRDVDLILSPTSHEQFEAYTDPLLNAWQDSTGISGEIGDKCAYDYSTVVAPDGTNFVLNGNRYQIQQEWSNAAGGCAKRYGANSLPVLNPTSLNFGVVPRGTSKILSITITNNGAGDLNILNIRVDTPPNYFGLNSALQWGTFHTGTGTTVQISFQPPANLRTSGPFSSDLIVLTDQPSYEETDILLSAQVGLPHASVAPTPLEFGDICPALW
jgi:hypothetical protein